MSTRSTIAMSAVAVVATLLSACAGEAGETAEEYITGELQEQIGLGDLEADCTEPAAKEAGETFTCTATAPDGQVVEFLGTMTADDAFDIFTSNLLTASDVEQIRQAAVTQYEVEDSAVTCPDGPVVLDETGAYDCQIVDVDGTQYRLIVSTGGLEPGVGARDLGFEVAEAVS